MAALTVNTTTRESLGSLTLHKFNFSSVDHGDTYASGLPNVVAYWANSEAAASSGGFSGVNIAESSGTFTIYMGATTDTDFNLYVLSRT